jgi:hypothetical protein
MKRFVQVLEVAAFFVPTLLAIGCSCCPESKSPTIVEFKKDPALDDFRDAVHDPKAFDKLTSAEGTMKADVQSKVTAIVAAAPGTTVKSIDCHVGVCRVVTQHKAAPDALADHKGPQTGADSLDGFVRAAFLLPKTAWRGPHAIVQSHCEGQIWTATMLLGPAPSENRSEMRDRDRANCSPRTRARAPERKPGEKEFK